MESKDIIKRLKLSCQDTLNYTFFDRVHNVAILKKTEVTSMEFPRMWKDIVK